MELHVPVIYGHSMSNLAGAEAEADFLQGRDSLSIPLAPCSAEHTLCYSLGYFQVESSMAASYHYASGTEQNISHSKFP